MDWASIGSAAIYGAIGGAAGALLGGLLALPFRNTKIGATMTTVLTVASVIIGLKVAEPLLRPYIGEWVESLVGQPVAEKTADDVVAEMRSQPLLAAILDREPETEAQLKQQFNTILETAADSEEAEQAAFDLGYQLSSSKTAYYLARARDKDILAFFEITTESLVYLNEADARFCYDYLYNPAGLIGMELFELKAKFGEQLYDRQQDAGAIVVTNAFDEIPDYDQQAAQLTINAAGMALYEKLGDERIGLITMGQAPETDADASAACEATAEMYRYLLDSENAADAIRHLFVLTATAA